MTPRPRPRSARLARAWPRLALAVAATAGTLALGARVLVEAPDGAAAPRAVARVLAPGPTAAPAAPVAAVTSSTGASSGPARPRPGSLRDVLRQDVALAGGELEAWALDPTLDPPARYGALRRLEAADPARAVGTAVAALTDAAPLVRLNAIALLSRSRDPRAADALARLDDRSKRLAAQLARR